MSFANGRTLLTLFFTLLSTCSSGWFQLWCWDLWKSSKFSFRSAFTVLFLLLSHYWDFFVHEVHDQQKPNGRQVSHLDVSDDDFSEGRLKNSVSLERRSLQSCRFFHILVPLSHLHDGLPNLHEVHWKWPKSDEIQVYRSSFHLLEHSFILFVVSFTIVSYLFLIVSLDHLWIDGACSFG